MDKIKSYYIVGVICFIVGAALVGGLVYRSGSSRIGYLGGKLVEISSINRQLTGRLVERETLVAQLAEDNRNLAESINRRQGIIDAAKRELESSRSSIDKIRALLKIIKSTE